MSEFKVNEAALSEASGVSKSTLSKKRRELLAEGVDYGLQKNATAYTKDGALAVLGALGVPCPADALKRAAGGLPDGFEKNGARVVAVVTRRFVPNFQILQARLEKNGENILVRVHNNLMFDIDQRIPVKKTDTWVWLLDASQPRRRGQIPGFEG